MLLWSGYARFCLYFHLSIKLIKNYRIYIGNIQVILIEMIFSNFTNNSQYLYNRVQLSQQ